MLNYDFVDFISLASMVVFGVTHYRDSAIVKYQPTVEDGISVDNRKLFFEYMHERYMIWLRRFKMKKPQPWTKNKILKEYKFTNTYRRLDRCSQFLLRHIKRARKKHDISDEEVAWTIILFRFINRIETFEIIGIPRMADFSIKKFCKKLRVLKDIEGKSVFTSAYITCQCSNKRDRIGNFEEMMGGIHRDWKKVWRVIRKAESMEAVYKQLQQFYGLGQFNSYEICIDLCYTGVLPDKWRDDFANPGPGCKVGIDCIYPFSTVSYHEAMRKLTDRQDKYFKEAGVEFRGERLTLQDIEFNLCEFGKYFKLIKGVGKSRMRLKPVTPNDAKLY